MTKQEILAMKLPFPYEDCPELGEYISYVEDGDITPFDWVRAEREYAEYKCFSKLLNIESYKQLENPDPDKINRLIINYNLAMSEYLNTKMNAKDKL